MQPSPGWCWTAVRCAAPRRWRTAASLRRTRVRPATRVRQAGRAHRRIPRPARLCRHQLQLLCHVKCPSGLAAQPGPSTCNQRHTSSLLFTCLAGSRTSSRSSACTRRARSQGSRRCGNDRRSGGEGAWVAVSDGLTGASTGAPMTEVVPQRQAALGLVCQSRCPQCTLLDCFLVLRPAGVLTSKKRRLIQLMEVLHSTRAKRYPTVPAKLLITSRTPQSENWVQNLGRAP